MSHKINECSHFNNTYKAKNAFFNKLKGVSGGIPLTFLAPRNSNSFLSPHSPLSPFTKGGLTGISGGVPLTCLELTGKTKIVGVFGDPIAHSLSPPMQNAAFKYLGLDYIYLPFYVKATQTSQAIKSLLYLNFKGINLTIPHKERAWKYLDNVDEEAQILRAVNTIDIRGNTLYGYNTDGKGFLCSLEKDHHFNPRKKSILILGAGGGARAIAIHLAYFCQGKIFIANRTFARAENLACYINRHIKRKNKIEAIPLKEKALKEIVGQINLLINTTSVGLSPGDPSLITPALFKMAGNLQFVYDLIYNPAETKLLKMARDYKIKAANGLGMLLYQGALAFEIWTKKKAPVEVMRAALQKSLYKN